MSLGDFIRDHHLWHRRCADVIDQVAFVTGGTSTASSDNFILAPTIGSVGTVLRLVDGQTFHFIADHTNTTTNPTLTVGSASAVTIKKIDGAASLGTLIAGDILANNAYIVSYSLSANAFVLLNPSQSAGYVAGINAAGTDQSGATAVTAPITNVGGGSGGVRLPAIKQGSWYAIYNTGSSAGCNVYPASGDAIGNLSANAALPLSAAQGAIFYAKAAASWMPILGAGANRILTTPAGSSTSFAKVGGVLFNYSADAGNSGTSETDLYSDSIAASTLGTNGDKLEAEYGGVFVSSGTATRQIKVYFGGTAILDTGALTLSLSSAWTIFMMIIRKDASTVRYMVSLTTEGAALAAYTSAGELGSLTLSNANTLKITGQAAGVGAATNDIVAKLGAVSWFPAA